VAQSHQPAQAGGISSVPPVEADTKNVVWAIGFQFDSTTVPKAIKIASMIDEHTRCSLLNIVERSITAERLVTELKTAFAVTYLEPDFYHRCRCGDSVGS
jgi:hypothetical protein